MAYQNRLPMISRISPETRDNDFIPIQELKQFDEMVEQILNKFNSMNLESTEDANISQKLKEIEYNLADALEFDSEGNITGFKTDSDGNPLNGENSIDNLLNKLYNFYNEFIIAMGGDPNIDNWKNDLQKYFNSAMTEFKNKIDSLFKNSANVQTLEAKNDNKNNYVLQNSVNLNNDETLRLNPDISTYTRNINVEIKEKGVETVVADVIAAVESSTVFNLKILNGKTYFDLNFVIDKDVVHVNCEKLIDENIKDLLTTLKLKVYKYTKNNSTRYVLTMNSAISEMYAFEFSGIFVSGYDFSNSNFDINNHNNRHVYKLVDTEEVTTPVLGETYYTKQTSEQDDPEVAEALEIYIAHNDLEEFEEGVDYYTLDDVFKVIAEKELIDGLENELSTDDTVIVQNKIYSNELGTLHIDIEDVNEIGPNKNVNKNDYLKSHPKYWLDETWSNNNVNRRPYCRDQKTTYAYGSSIFQTKEIMPGEVVNTHEHNSKILSKLYGKDRKPMPVLSYGGIVGKTWAQSSLTSGYFQALTIANDGTVIAGSDSDGIYYSTDNGRTWVQSSLDSGDIVSLTVANNGTVIAGSDIGDGIYYSTDNGRTWVQSSLNNVWVKSLTVANDGTVIAGTEDDGIFYSIDNGKTWVQSSLDSDMFWTLTVTNDGTIIAGSYSDYGIYYSTDNGRTWTQSNITSGDVVSLTIANDGTVIAGSYSGYGIYYSTDNGKTWTQSSLDSGMIRSLTIANDGTVIAGSDSGYGIYYSTDNGKTWAQSSLDSGMIRSLTIANDGTVIAGSGNGIHYSTDNGRTWTQSSLNNGWSESLTVANDGTVIAGSDSGYGIYYSEYQISKKIAVIEDNPDLNIEYNYGSVHKYDLIDNPDLKYELIKLRVGSTDYSRQVIDDIFKDLVFADNFKLKLYSDEINPELIHILVFPDNTTENNFTDTQHFFQSFVINIAEYSENNPIVYIYDDIVNYPSPMDPVLTDNTFKDVISNGTTIVAISDTDLYFSDDGTYYDKINKELIDISDKTNGEWKLIRYKTGYLLYNWKEIWYSDSGNTWISFMDGDRLDRTVNVINCDGTERRITDVHIDQIKPYESQVFIGISGYLPDEGKYVSYVRCSDLNLEAMLEDADILGYNKIDNAVIFAGSGSGNDIYYSTDNGRTWVQSLLSGGSIYAFTIVNDGTVIAGGNKGIYYSTDNGKIWTQSSLTSGLIQSLTIANDGTIIASDTGNSSKGIYYSTDNGKTWTRSNINSVAILSLTVANDGTVIACGSNGIYYSTDNGRTWIQSSLSSGYFYEFTIVDDGTVIVGGNGIYYSTDNGRTWTQSNNTNAQIYSLTVTNAGTIIAGTNSKGIYYSTDNGRTWTQSSLTSGSSRSFTIVNDGTVIAGSSNGIYYSTDNGKTWTRSNINSVAILSLTVANDGTVVAGGNSSKGIYYSTDNGRTWTQSSLTSGHFMSFAIIPLKLEEHKFGSLYFGGFTNNRVSMKDILISTYTAKTGSSSYETVSTNDRSINFIYSNDTGSGFVTTVERVYKNPETSGPNTTFILGVDPHSSTTFNREYIKGLNSYTGRTVALTDDGIYSIADGTKLDILSNSGLSNHKIVDITSTLTRHGNNWYDHNLVVVVEDLTTGEQSLLMATNWAQLNQATSAQTTNVVAGKAYVTFPVNQYTLKTIPTNLDIISAPLYKGALLISKGKCIIIIDNMLMDVSSGEHGRMLDTRIIQTIKCLRTNRSNINRIKPGAKGHTIVNTLNSTLYKNQTDGIYHDVSKFDNSLVDNLFDIKNSDDTLTFVDTYEGLPVKTISGSTLLDSDTIVDVNTKVVKLQNGNKLSLDLTANDQIIEMTSDGTFVKTVADFESSTMKISNMFVIDGVIFVVASDVETGKQIIMKQVGDESFETILSVDIIDFYGIYGNGIVISAYDYEKPYTIYVFDSVNYTFREYENVDANKLVSFNNIYEFNGNLYIVNGTGSNPNITSSSRGIYKLSKIVDGTTISTGYLNLEFIYPFDFVTELPARQPVGLDPEEMVYNSIKIPVFKTNFGGQQNLIFIFDSCNTELPKEDNITKFLMLDEFDFVTDISDDSDYPEYLRELKYILESEKELIFNSVEQGNFIYTDPQYSLVTQTVNETSDSNLVLDDSESEHVEHITDKFYPNHKISISSINKKLRSINSSLDNKQVNFVGLANDYKLFLYDKSLSYLKVMKIGLRMYTNGELFELVLNNEDNYPESGKVKEHNVVINSVIIGSGNLSNKIFVTVSIYDENYNKTSGGKYGTHIFSVSVDDYLSATDDVVYFEKENSISFNDTVSTDGTSGTRCISYSKKMILENCKMLPDMKCTGVEASVDEGVMTIFEPEYSSYNSTDKDWLKLGSLDTVSGNHYYDNVLYKNIQSCVKVLDDKIEILSPIMYKENIHGDRDDPNQYELVPAITSGTQAVELACEAGSLKLLSKIDSDSSFTEDTMLYPSVFTGINDVERVPGKFQYISNELQTNGKNLQIGTLNNQHRDLVDIRDTLSMNSDPSDETTNMQMTSIGLFRYSEDMSESTLSIDNKIIKIKIGDGVIDNIFESLSGIFVQVKTTVSDVAVAVGEYSTFTNPIDACATTSSVQFRLYKLTNLPMDSSVIYINDETYFKPLEYVNQYNYDYEISDVIDTDYGTFAVAVRKGLSRVFSNYLVILYYNGNQFIEKNSLQLTTTLDNKEYIQGVYNYGKSIYVCGKDSQNSTWFTGYNIETGYLATSSKNLSATALNMDTTKRVRSINKNYETFPSYGKGLILCKDGIAVQSGNGTTGIESIITSINTVTFNHPTISSGIPRLWKKVGNRNFKYLAEYMSNLGVPVNKYVKASGYITFNNLPVLISGLKLISVSGNTEASTVEFYVDREYRLPVFVDENDKLPVDTDLKNIIEPTIAKLMKLFKYTNSASSFKSDYKDFLTKGVISDNSQKETLSIPRNITKCNISLVYDK